MQKNEFETMVKELLPAVTEQAMDRMSLISSAITKAIRGDNSVHARYMVVGAQPEPEETMLLHLNPDEQRLVAQALAEQRIRLGPQAEGEEKLLRRMTGRVT